MLVSILIPLYNSEKHISETIKSALNQTYKNIEVIIVDDGSTDNSYTIAKRFNSNMVKVYQQKNRGACAARNLAFKNSTGDYIQYLDADDVLSPDKIEKQIKIFDRFKNDIIISGKWGRFYNSLENVSFESQAINKSYCNTIEWLIDSWTGKGMAQTSIWLSPRKLIEKAGIWNESLTINQDGEFFSRVLLQASEINYCQDAKVYYRSGETSSISQKKKTRQNAESLLLSYKLYKENVKHYQDNAFVRKALANNFLNFIYQNHKEFPSLTKQAEHEFYKLNVGKMWPVGGKRFRKLANLIGYKRALILKKIF